MKIDDVIKILDRSDLEMPLDFNAAALAFEYIIVMKALNENSQVKARAARALGLNRTTLVEKLKKLGIANHRI